MNTHHLLRWYDANARDLPWRQSKDPYRIWLSEVMLQQTRVEQGLPYYLRFLDAFPRVTNLAHATEDQVLKLWQGLGYYSRARNLHSAAKQVVQQHGGHFPKTYHALLNLPGVGPYTAAAIASISGNEPVAVLDGNVIRVLARLFDVPVSFQTAEGKRTFQALADEHLHAADPGKYNQAIMELGALICSPRQPDCLKCPLATECIARQNNTQLSRPVKLPKVPPKQRIMHYFIVEHQQKVLVAKRNENDIWAGLYQFPLLEGELPDMIHGAHPERIWSTTHLLSHQRIEANFYRLNNDPNQWPGYTLTSPEELALLPVSQLIHRFLQRMGDNLFQ